MFCPKCGSNVADGSAFCGNCGNSFAPAPAAPATAPAWAPAAPAQPPMSAKMRGLSKKAFLQTEAAPAVKNADNIAKVVFLAILALILVATVTFNTVSVVDLPLIKMTVGESEREEMEHSMDSASKAMEDMENVMDEIEEELGSQAAREAKKVINKWEKAVRKLSLANLIAVVDATQGLADETADKLDMDGEVEALEDVAKVLKTVRTVIYVFGVIIALVALWAATRKAIFPCVLGILLSAPIYCLMASVLLGILIVVAFIVLAVFCSKVNKAWKKAPQI